MAQVGFETTIPLFEQAKTVNALDPAATLTGLKLADVIKFRSGMTVRIAFRNYLPHE
jgi:hypothetical protein